MKLKNIFITVCSLLCIISCTNKKESAINTEDITENIQVSLIKIEDKVLDQPIFAHGLLTTNEDAKLSFKISGIIKKMYLKEGDRINKGQLLGQLDLTEINAEKIQITENYNKAQRDYNRAMNLFTDSVVTLEYLENVKTIFTIAKQSLDVINYNISHSQITAPSSGVILKKIANEGEYINPGMPVYEISKNNAEGLIVKVYVSVHDWLNIKERDKASIELEGFPDTKFEGLIKHIASYTDPASGLYMIDVQIVSPNTRTVVGMFAKVEIFASKQIQYKTIPVGCISEGNESTAYVYMPDGNRVKKKQVKIIQIKDGLAYISSDLKDTDYVINRGAGFLSENSLITIH